MDILGGGLVGRPAEEIGKLFDVADILGLSLGAEPADRHVLDQSPAYRTDGLVGHWGLLSWVRFKAPQSQDRTPASATPRDPSLATNYRESGFVHRRDLSIHPGFGEGRLTTPKRTPTQSTTSGLYQLVRNPRCRRKRRYRGDQSGNAAKRFSI